MGPARAVIAHSMGGAATAFAIRRGLETERVVLIGAPADPSRYVREFLRNLGTDDRLAEAMMGGFARRYDFDWDDVPLIPARGLGVPALVIHDEDDREAPYADARAIAGTWPSAELVTTSGLGHNRILRDPAVIDRVVGWLAETLSPIRRGALV
jgi:pimeloyl-ACP methyl ester carboxylesterase